jgi:serine phosphatase RsbU (regulator of sigma subunit)/ligand-binding sensor domain-containing protein
VGCEGKGLWRRQAGAWTHFEPQTGINALTETTEFQPGCWAGTRGHGVLRWDGHQWIQAGKGLDKAQVWALLETQTPGEPARLLAGTKDGLFALEDGAWVPFLKAQGISDSVNCLAVDREDPAHPALWIGLWQKGLARWDGHAIEWQDKAAGLPSLMATSLCYEPQPHGGGILWMGTHDQGLAWRRNGRWRILDRSRDALFPGVYALLPGKGLGPTLWFGSRGAGVGALDATAWRSLEPATDVVPELGTALAPSKGDGLWIGSSQGLWELDATGVHRDPHPGAPAAPINSILAETDPQGRERVLIASPGGVFQLQQGRWNPLALPAKVKAERPWSLLRSADGLRLWVGLQGALACQEGSTWKTFSRAEGMPGDWIYALCEVETAGAGRSLWVGSRDAGAFRYQGGRWDTFPLPKGRTGQVWCNHLLATRSTDGRQWLWAAFVGTGLGRLELGRESDGWTLWTPENLPGLPTTSIYRLEQDRAGRIYLGHNHGITRFELKDAGKGPEPREMRHFSRGDGVPEEAMASQGSLTDAHGRIWFGNQRALNVFDPEQEERAEAPLQPQFERVEVPGGRLDPTDGLVIKASQRRFRIVYVLPHYHRREDVRFRTQLEGVESEPGPWVPEATRDFTGLPGGKYRLIVWAMDYAGRVSEPVSWSFEVQPPLWLTWWAKSFYILAGLAGVFAVVRFRTRVLQERAEALEALVHERTRDLETAKEGAEKALAEVKVLSDVVLESIHYARTIQQTLLPARADLETHLRDYFVIWTPRDVIGGDLFWLQGKDGDFTFAAIDCTGHGVPGAIMTMLAGATLNRVVHEMGTEDPAAVLTAVSVLIRATLDHEERSPLTDSGLDMGICRVDPAAGRLTFAGANIPLFYVQDGKVRDLAPDRSSIGYQSTDPAFPFANRELDLAGVEACYMTTDGLFSIMGGERNLPFGKSRFRRFIQDHHALPFPAQKEALNQVMADYRGTQPPRDDITILGFRLPSAETGTGEAPC